MTPEETAIQLGALNQRVLAIEKVVDKIDKQQTQIQDLTISINSLASSVKSMVEKQVDHEKRIDALEDAPGEQMKETKKTLYASIISSVGTALAIGIIKLITMGM